MKRNGTHAASSSGCSPTNNCVLFASRRLKLGQVGRVGLFVTTIVGAQKYLRGCHCQHAQMHMLAVSIIVSIGITCTARAGQQGPPTALVQQTPNIHGQIHLWTWTLYYRGM